MADPGDTQKRGTGGDPAGGANPGGTRPTKAGPPAGDDAGSAGSGVQSGDRNDMTTPDPIRHDQSGA